MLSQVYKSNINRNKNKGEAVITCRREHLNFYENTRYNNLEVVPLASKGWNHSKSHGDFFTVHGNPESRDSPNVPFSNLGINEDFEKILNEMNVKAFTNFQSEVIPVIRSGVHTLIAAETGCGKTLAYLLPLIEKLSPTTALNSPQVLVLVPNRELALQVGEVASKLSSTANLKVKVIVGGRTKQIMLQADHACVDILVATPGAIGKLSTVGLFKLQDVNHTVLDEADTLVDDSFVDRMESLIKRVSSSQIILSSATLPRKLPAVLEPIMDTLIQCKSQRLHKPLMNITQKFHRLTKSAKPSQLLSIAKRSKDPMIVFTNRNETCNWLAMFLRENGLNCANINGDMNYAIRMEQWDDFKSGKASILSATDVGSRGLDTTELKQVVNYDFPLYTADYIHRIGRIGRLGSSDDCKLTHFVSGPIEIKLVQNIEMAIRTGSELKYVDGNITGIVQNKILKKMRGAS